MKCRPPKFKEQESYKTYRALVERWSEITDETPGSERATALILNIENKRALNEVVKRTEQIQSVKNLLEVLDQLFRKEVDPIGELFQ